MKLLTRLSRRTRTTLYLTAGTTLTTLLLLNHYPGLSSRSFPPVHTLPPFIHEHPPSRMQNVKRLRASGLSVSESSPSAAANSSSSNSNSAASAVSGSNSSSSAASNPSSSSNSRSSSSNNKQQQQPQPLDLLIIGGGATGCGCALDAALRGLRVGLVEQGDFASGTSAKSTKLIHGGVRYLEKALFGADLGQFKLVYEALRERSILIHQAPHLCHPIATLLPCYAWWELPWYYCGLKFYDLVAACSLGTLQTSTGLTAGASKERFPTLRGSGPGGRKLSGSIVYYDGQMDDARVNVSLALSASCHGAAVANYTQVVSLIQDGEKTRTATGVVVRDELTGEEYPIRAKAIVNATGPFTDLIRKMGEASAPEISIPAAGVHVTLPGFYTPESTVLIVPKTADGRVVFLVPWLGATIAGTTDEVVPLSREPRGKESDVQFILNTLKDYIGIEMKRSDVKSVWCGIRPLAKDPSAAMKNGASASVLREHSVFLSPADGVVSVTGGKWTTYRKMAQDTIDFVLKHKPEIREIEGGSGGGKAMAKHKIKPCVTENIQLIGARRFGKELLPQLAQDYANVFSYASAGRLCEAYGDRAALVAEIAKSEDQGREIVSGFPFIEAEVTYCATMEYAERAIDFLARRTRLAFLDVTRAKEAVPRVVELMGEVKGWGTIRRAVETAEAYRYLDTFTAESV